MTRMSDLGRLLIVAPHADDLELGAGGTVHRLAADGWDVRAVVLSLAAESLPEGFEAGSNLEECHRAMKSLGVASSRIEDFPVRHFGANRQAILDLLIAERNKFRPTMVIAPSSHDFHQDHAVVADEALRAFAGKCSLYGFDMPWNTVADGPSFYVELSDENIDAKVKALAEYHSQVAKGSRYFEEDFIRGLAAVRAARCGYSFAERFEVRWTVLPMSLKKPA